MLPSSVRERVDIHPFHLPLSFSTAHPALPDSVPNSKFLPPRKDTVGARMQQGFLVEAFTCDDFRMYEFKIRQCMRTRSHDWIDCPFAHPGEKAKRRDPRKFHYSGLPCPDYRKGSCKKGDMCKYAHGVFECWLHPARYRTQACKDGELCRRRVCFFAHSPQQLRHIQPSSVDTDFPADVDLAIEVNGESYEKAGIPPSRTCNVTKIQVENASHPAPVQKLPSQVCSASMVNLSPEVTVTFNSEVISSMEFPNESFSMTAVSPCDATQSLGHSHTSCFIEQEAIVFPSFMLHEGYHGGSSCHEIGVPSFSPNNLQMGSSIEMTNEPSKCKFPRGLNVHLRLPLISTLSSSSFYLSPPFSPCISTPKNEETDIFFTHYSGHLRRDDTTVKSSNMVAYKSYFQDQCSSQPHDHSLCIQDKHRYLESALGSPCPLWENSRSPFNSNGPEFVDISCTKLDCRYDMMLSKIHGGVESAFENTVVPDLGWVNELVM